MSDSDSSYEEDESQSDNSSSHERDDASSSSENDDDSYSEDEHDQSSSNYSSSEDSEDERDMSNTGRSNSKTKTKSSDDQRYSKKFQIEVTLDKDGKIVKTDVKVDEDRSKRNKVKFEDEENTSSETKLDPDEGLTFPEDTSSYSVQQLKEMAIAILLAPDDKIGKHPKDRDLAKTDILRKPLQSMPLHQKDTNVLPSEFTGNRPYYRDVYYNNSIRNSTRHLTTKEQDDKDHRYYFY